MGPGKGAKDRHAPEVKRRRVCGQVTVWLYHDRYAHCHIATLDHPGPYRTRPHALQIDMRSQAANHIEVEVGSNIWRKGRRCLAVVLECAHEIARAQQAQFLA